MQYSKRRKFFIAFICFIAVFFLCLSAIEIYFRYERPSLYLLDSELGWKIKPNFHRSFTQMSLDEKPYDIDYSTNQLGLRTHGDFASAKIKLLVLGDSYTMENYASNNDMWYSVLVDRLNSNESLKNNSPTTLTPGYFVWAGGGGGWGSYQELILLRRLLKQIRPDVFILQFCDNDFVNNHQNWESTAITRSQIYRRPYLDLANQTHFSTDTLAPLWRIQFLGNSRLLNLFDILIQRIQAKYYKGFGPAIDKKILDQYEIESIAITENLLRLMRTELGDIPSYMVNCNPIDVGPNRHWQDYARKAGFIPLHLPSDSVLQLMRKEVAIHRDGLSGYDSYKSHLFIDGNHLNPAGNKTFGNALADELLQDPLFRKVLIQSQVPPT